MAGNEAFLRRCIALASAKGMGSVQFKQKIANDPKLERSLKGFEMNWQQADKDLAWASKANNHHIIPLSSPCYPKLLAEIYDPPPLLYVVGDVDYLHQPQLAMVGSRRASLGGLNHAKAFASQFAALGLGVVSGLALGVDAASHRGALAVEAGWTIAVLAHGLNFVYPRKHYALAEAITEQGALVSEFSPCTRASPGLFPRRNRIISGLALGVLVVEATIKSGSLITANLALEQGREVFAIPGNIQLTQVAGCHALIRDGAKLVTQVSDVLEELGGLLSKVIHAKNAVYARVYHRNMEECFLTKLLEGMDHVVSIDLLCLKMNLTVEEVVIKLASLELKGLVERKSGGYIRSM